MSWRTWRSGATTRSDRPERTIRGRLVGVANELDEDDVGRRGADVLTRVLLGRQPTSQTPLCQPRVRHRESPDQCLEGGEGVP